MKTPDRQDIIEAFLQVRDNMRFSAGRETDLPLPKPIIRDAIVQELMQTPSSQHVVLLESAYMDLEAFVSDEEFEVVKANELMIERVSDLVSQYPDEPQRAAQTVGDTNSEKCYEIQRAIHNRQVARVEELERLLERMGGLSQSEYLN